MKTIIKYILSPLLLVSLSPLLHSQEFEMRLMQDDFDYLAVQMRETSGTGTPTTATDIMDIQFELRWAQSYSTSLDAGLICSAYKLTDGLNSRQEDDGFYWRVFAADSVPFHPQSNWAVNQWRTIGRFQAIEPGPEDTASFAISPEDFSIQGLNINLDGTDYPIAIGDSLPEYVYPTLVYDFIWRGGATPAGGFNQNSWTCGLNWEDGCGLRFDVSIQPTGSSKCLIPGGLPFYPTNFNNFASGQCDVLRMNSGAHLVVPGSKTLSITGNVDINPSADIIVVAGGDLQIGQP